MSSLLLVYEEIKINRKELRFLRYFSTRERFYLEGEKIVLGRVASHVENNKAWIPTSLIHKQNPDSSKI